MDGLLQNETIDVARHTAGYTRNLLILHSPVAEDIADWLEVKRLIEERAPDIEVRIGTNGARNSVTRRWQASRPSLVFCASWMVEYEPKGGTIYSARAITKLEQIDRLARAGLPVPLTLMLTRELALDRAQWGDYVVVKPLSGGKGQGIRFLRIGDVAARYDELTLDGKRDMVIQPYIEHSEDGYPTGYRVLTLFGRVLYCARNRWGAPRPSLEQIASDPNGVIASNDYTFGRVRTVWNDPEIIALGERAHSAFPECPVLGVDVIRDANAGKLFVMEINAEGTTWHLSSSVAKTIYTPEHVRNLYAQFGALDRTAQLLIEKTRLEAS